MATPEANEIAEVHAPGPPVSELDALVARTTGPQPWRKAFHAFNALWIAGLVALLELPNVVVLSILGGVAAALLTADFLRLRHEGTNRLFFRAFASLASPREARGIASSTWYAIGMLLTFAVFPRDVAISSVLVMGLGDPVAGYFGRRFGRRPFLGGTLEGTLAFVAVTALVLLTRHAAPAALSAATLSALAERRSWPLDDNLAVPLACGASLVAAQWLGAALLS